MSAKILSEKALSVITNYLKFNVGFAVCNVPYYNNKRVRARARLRAQIGKGNPEEIMEEAESTAALQKINLKALDSISLKKFLVDNNIGVDCSGLVYHVLTAEKGELNFSYPFSKGILGFIRSKIRKVENAGVSTLAHDKNSRVIPLKFVEPGDIITILGGPDNSDRDHVLIIHEVDYKDDVVVSISYTHTVAWPTDGEYGHGVRKGLIRITDVEKPLTEQNWIEDERSGEENYTHTRALKSKTELRRTE